MELMMLLLNKVFVFAFIFACLYLLMEGIVPFGFKFYRALDTGTYEKPTGKKMLWVGLALSFILTMLITGFLV